MVTAPAEKISVLEVLWDQLSFAFRRDVCMAACSSTAPASRYWLELSEGERAAVKAYLVDMAQQRADVRAKYRSATQGVTHGACADKAN